MVLSKDGSQMKNGSHPALAKGKVRYVGDHVAVVIAETLDQAKDAAAEVNVSYGTLPAVADLAKARDANAAQLHDNAPKNTVYEWVIGEADAVDAAIKQAKHVTKLTFVNNRLIPNAIEPRAAIGEYEPGTDSYTLWSTSQNPHVLRLGLSAFIGLTSEHKIPRDFARRRRRLRSKIFIRKRRSASGRRRRSGAPCAGPPSAVHPGGRALAAITSRPSNALDDNNKMAALRVKTLANLGAYLSTFSSAVPTFL
jgi:carbon-monoxide dehydrogenase large subunit